MLLGEIKLQALRIMFADTDIMFSMNELMGVDENGQNISSLYDNGNTKEKLVRMNDSINRAIDLYYQHCGRKIQFKNVNFAYEEIDGVNVYKDYIDISKEKDIHIPTKLEMIINGRKEKIDFLYDEEEKKIYPNEENYYLQRYTPSQYVFRLYYDKKEKVVENNSQDNTFDLNEIGIPEEVQRRIPYFIKGELYEEDESNLSHKAKNEYVEFLIYLSKKTIKNRTRIKSVYDRYK